MSQMSLEEILKFIGYNPHQLIPMAMLASIGLGFIGVGIYDTIEYIRERGKKKYEAFSPQHPEQKY